MRVLKHIKQLSFLFVFLTACGGGGGGQSTTLPGGGTVKFFAGTWAGIIFLVSNDCPFDTDDSVVFEHLVNQDGLKVLLDTPQGRVYSGTVNSDGDGFTVTNEVLPVSEVSPGIVCTLDAGIQYSNVNGDEADVASAIVLRCADTVSSFQCVTGYAGVAERVS